ncbi:WD40 repeat-like protein [Lindgomyces ingoldianus]|uniref:WD40 repeat-like protein n=1 Tax=Lindgomyces ingoldianus TaxID=673940 RepID=A0ACB6QCU8_9PLEO|nr:WD40 repeat-like protein [Lindgomyces ingoldianus]KAF2464685.1 WD40 repeat-like protein [Lindgomyces ingoldianus]
MSFGTYDTFCINKSNNTELSEVINSMFRWYRNADICYVYLSDEPSLQPWEEAFSRCRWFTQGWTLQELLAPPQVDFFWSHGKKLGNKVSLERLLQEITGIPARALQGTPLSEFSVEEQLAWATNRQTKREEDRAYSLLGLSIFTCPSYMAKGELTLDSIVSSLLDQLRYTDEAAFNSSTKQHDPLCLPNTRVDLLQEIYNWGSGQDERLIFWLNGLAGTGKSTIARAVARTYFNKKLFGASFFFSRGGGDVGHVGKFFTTISKQLANSIPTLHQHICNAIKARGDIAKLSSQDQWRHLVLGPLSRLANNLCPPMFTVGIDALDECDNENDIRTLLHLLAEDRFLDRAQLRIFLTSRPEVPIRYGLYPMPDPAHRDYGHRDYVLHNISPPIIDQDIYTFLEDSLKRIGYECSLNVGWPGEGVIKSLVKMASGLLIWAATACRFIREGKKFATRRPSTILTSSRSAVTAPEKYLDQIYITVLKHSIFPDYTNEEKEEVYHMLREILGSTALLFSPLSACALSRLLVITKKDIYQTLDDQHSVLDVPKSDNQPLRLHHPSFRDFLLSHKRCEDQNFWIHEKQAHQTLARSCIRLIPMSSSGNSLWIAQLRDNDLLEALGWMGKISEGIHAISSLEKIIMHRTIAIAPLQIYCSALIFTPEMSIVRKQFSYCIPRWIRRSPKVERDWTAALQTLEGPSSSVSSVAFSHNSTWLASGSYDNTVRIWDVSNGECLQTLEGHSSSVSSVTFSHDSTRLASESNDNTVKIWDASSSECLQTLEGHTGLVSSVAFSHDSTRLASGSGDCAVKIWDVSSGDYLQTLKGHSSSVYSVAFSHDSARLASGSYDNTVKVWDASSGECLQTLDGHSRPVSLVTFSHNSIWLASGLYNNTVKIWDASSGECLQTLEGHSDWVSSVAFSHDSTRLVSGSYDNTVKIRDASNGECLQTLDGDSSSVSLVAFSHDSTRLASGPGDYTVNQGLAVSTNGVWITYNLENLLWMPSGFRPLRFIVSEKVIGIGTTGGKVWTCHFERNTS